MKKAPFLHGRVVVHTFGSGRRQIRDDVHVGVTVVWHVLYTSVDVLLPPEFATGHVVLPVLQVANRLTHVEHVTVDAVRQPYLALGEVAQVTVI